LRNYATLMTYTQDMVRRYTGVYFTITNIAEDLPYDYKHQYTTCSQPTAEHIFEAVRKANQLEQCFSTRLLTHLVPRYIAEYTTFL